MEPNTRKFFEGLCLVASIINYIAVFVIFQRHFQMGGGTIGETAIILLKIAPGIVFASVIASPILGIPYWLALFTSRKRSKVATFFLYFYVVFMMFAFLGAAGHGGILTLMCAYNFAQVVTISLSLWILHVASKGNERYKY